jgi:diguanylate cyclase (GGDEF)-like protein
LPPGDYRFEVFARNPESGTSSAVAGVPFRVLAPWWLRWWFLGICIVAVATLLWLLLWLRTRHLVARQRKLEALVKERTHELEASQAALRIQATHDALTGLFNRAVILDLLDQEMARMQREGRMMAVLLVDIDHFKRVNDTYGHLAGDAVLRCFAEKLSKSIRTYDHVGRYGGEEFLMLVGNLPLQEAEERLACIHSELTDLAVEFEGRDIRITCSIGVSFVLPGGSQLEVSQALSAADKALYEAKRRGRNCVVRAEQSDPAKMKILTTHI